MHALSNVYILQPCFAHESWMECFNATQHATLIWVNFTSSILRTWSCLWTVWTCIQKNHIIKMCNVNEARILIKNWTNIEFIRIGHTAYSKILFLLCVSYIKCFVHNVCTDRTEYFLLMITWYCCQVVVKLSESEACFTSYLTYNVLYVLQHCATVTNRSNLPYTCLTPHYHIQLLNQTFYVYGSFLI